MILIKKLRAENKNQSGFLQGKMLIAGPAMSDPRFAKSLIYICAHSTDGAVGLVVNQPAPNMTFPDLLEQMELITEGDRIMLPPKAQGLRVMRGGPVETTRGFVLHSRDVVIEDESIGLSEDVYLTGTVDMLKAIIKGYGPEYALLALGYAGWGKGQLEAELQTSSWLICEARKDLVFDHNTLDNQYDEALHSIGVDPMRLSSEVGRG